MPIDSPPVCPECEKIIWPNETGVRLFLWYEGDQDDDPLKDELCRAAITHLECAEAFGPGSLGSSCSGGTEGGTDSANRSNKPSAPLPSIP
jgi:hypothetical protein